MDHALDALPLGSWKFRDWVGARIDAVSGARLITQSAWDALYPQTEAAFSLREDDVARPGAGQWRGEFWGKYMLCAIAACRYYGDGALRERIAAAAHGLLKTQDESGYIGTYRDAGFLLGNNWNVWCRKYTLWALVEAWELLGDDAILRAAERFCDHLISQVGPDGVPIAQTGNFRGMPSSSILLPIVKLYAATGNGRYLEFAEFIVSGWGPKGILGKGLADEPVHEWAENPFDWAKGYELISCAEGLLALSDWTGNAAYFAAAENIHKNLVEWERTGVGSVSFDDKLIGSRFLVNTLSEICDAVYWNRLSHALLLRTGEAKYLDEIERTLYNSLLCASSPDGSWGLRRLRTSHEHIPAHTHFLRGHQCCVDNLPRGLFQAAESAAFTKGNDIYIGLYEAADGAVETEGGRISIRVRGDLIGDGKIAATLGLEAPARLAVHLRIPAWSGKSAARVNGETALEAAPGWLRIERVWKDGDVLRLDLHPDLRVEFFDDTRFAPDHPLVRLHEQRWAKLGRIGEEGTAAGQIVHVTEADVLPHERAAMFFKGPVALSRDARLGDGDIFERLGKIDPGDIGTLEQLDPPPGIRLAYVLALKGSKKIRLCDFASAGNTWAMDSKFGAWQLL